VSKGCIDTAPLPHSTMFRRLSSIALSNTKLISAVGTMQVIGGGVGMGVCNTHTSRESYIVMSKFV
jgi:hypothetical protein